MQTVTARYWLAGCQQLAFVKLACVGVAWCVSANAVESNLTPIRYIDAHSHFLMPVIAPDEQIALFKRADMAAVVLTDSNPERLQAVVKRYPGYVIPFISFSRRARPAGDPAIAIDANAVKRFEQLHDAGAVCGFGELGARTQPAMDASDAAALHNRFRLSIYELAAARGVPVMLHVDLADEGIVDSFARVASSYPGMPLILAHAGRLAGADVIERLLNAHPNIHVDLSTKLDPLPGWGNSAAPAGAKRLTMLDTQGALLPEWRRLLEVHSNRFLFAMDATFAEGSNRGNHILEMADVARKAFAPLPRSAHEAIAHGNLERLVRGCRAWPVPRTP